MQSTGTQPATLSPRELARANGVSQSSGKSWIDRGCIPAHLTAGGHRRVDFVPALRCLRESGQEVVHPDSFPVAPFGRPEPVSVLEERPFALLSASEAETLAQTLLAAAEAAGAQLVWVSVGYVDDVAERRTAIAGLVAALAQFGTLSAIGGRELEELDLDSRGDTILGPSMQDLADTARQFAVESDQ